VLIIGLLSWILGKRAVFHYVRKHDPAVQELLQAARINYEFLHDRKGSSREVIRLRDAINVIDEEKCETWFTKLKNTLLRT
jgi:hypothetical protein